jgi:hypothetical protein
MVMVKYPAERVPFPRRDGLTASLRALGQGESFLIPDPKETTRRVVHAAAVRVNIPVSIRKVEDGLRVFRLTSWPRRERKAKADTGRHYDENTDFGA